MTALAMDQLGSKTGLSMFVPLSKIDPDQRMVFGYASTEMRDGEGEIITVDALKSALPGYMRFANIREMHQLSAVGTTKQARADEKGLYIGAKIVDNAAWEKVKAGVYKGFSVGGNVTSRDPADKNKILGIDLVEISLVDRPCNPECLIDMWKRERDPSNPVQTWDCGVAGHRHLQKAEATTCMGDQAAEGSFELNVIRGRLVKAVGELDGPNLRAALAAFEKASAPAKDAEDAEPEVEEEAAEEAKEEDEAAAADEKMPDNKPAAKAAEAEPLVGDKIAFTNDRYVEKGPSAGVIARVEDGHVFVDHSDVVGDDLEWSMLDAPELKLNDAGERIWLVKSEAMDTIGRPGSCIITVLGKVDGSPAKMTTGLWSPVAKAAEPAPEPEKVEAVAKAAGDYGDDAEAGYADPGFREDKKARLPLRDGGQFIAKRIKAAWTYIGRPENQAAYTAEQVTTIKAKVADAWKEAIDPAGPEPSAKAVINSQTKDLDMNRDTLTKLGQPDAAGGFKNGLIAATSAISLMGSLADFQRRLRPADASGDPSRIERVITMFTDVCKALAGEEIAAMLADKTTGDLEFPAALTPEAFCYAQPVVELAKSAQGGTLAKRFTEMVGDRTGEPNYENLIKAIEALVQKGHNEWSQSRPANSEGANDDFPARLPDTQGSGDAWPAEMKQAAQKIHDQAVKMGAACEHKVEKAKKADGEKVPDGEGEDGKKDPPKPGEGDADMKGKDDEKKMPGKEGEEAVEEEKAKKSDIAELTKAMTSMGEVLSALVLNQTSGGRNPPQPGRTRVVEKAVDAFDGGEVLEKARQLDPHKATESDRQAVLKATLSRPQHIQR